MEKNSRDYPPTYKKRNVGGLRRMCFCARSLQLFEREQKRMEEGDEKYFKRRIFDKH